MASPQLEARATEAERRLDAIEAKLAGLNCAITAVRVHHLHARMRGGMTAAACGRRKCRAEAGHDI